MWLYVFGSIARGEIDSQSDIDILAVVTGKTETVNLPKKFLTYSVLELESSFSNGDLFAHHLMLESKLIYSSDNSNIIQKLGPPDKYKSGAQDIEHFIEIGNVALSELLKKTCSYTFELGLLYMVIRDIAMILSYHESDVPTFSKYAPYHITPTLLLERDKYDFIKQCRASSTRGVQIDEKCNLLSNNDLSKITAWLKSARRAFHERLQREN